MSNSALQKQNKNADKESNIQENKKSDTCLFDEMVKGKKLICSKSKRVLDFDVEYSLFSSEKDGRKSFDITLTKYENAVKTRVDTVIDFEWREKEAQNVFETLYNGDVTPMCLEECVLELI